MPVIRKPESTKNRSTPVHPNPKALDTALIAALEL
jgi:hypothetical protein